MRWGLIAWCVFGTGLIGLKAHLDLTGAKYPEVALRTGDRVYYVPRNLVKNSDGWRSDLLRLAGCWDAREQGVVRAIAVLAGCDGPQALNLDLSRLSRTIDGDVIADGAPRDFSIWRNYEPPFEQLLEIEQAWTGGGLWANRRVIVRDDWQLVRIETVGTPWIYLFTLAPAQVSSLSGAPYYAGRCFRSDISSDLGMTCGFVTPLSGGAALEYALGPEFVAQYPQIRDRSIALVNSWSR